MKLIELSEHSFIRLTWNSISGWLDGFGFDLGWFYDSIPLTGFQICVFEWADDESGLTVFRLQILYFLFAINLDAAR